MRRSAALFTLLAALLAAGLTARPAGAAVTVPGAAGAARYGGSAAGNAALDWAEAHAAGHPYVYGGTGPGGFDCSGLVSDALAHVGVQVPHNTVAMVNSGRLVRTYSPQRGSLAFWGPTGAPYHVEFATTWYRTTFGAHHSGTVVGYARYGPGFAPSAFYNVR